MEKIVKLTPFHCARGIRGCEKCKALAEEGEKYCLIDIFPGGGEIARPIMQVEFKGGKIWAEFDLLMIFEHEQEAQEYSKKNNVPLEDKNNLSI